MRWAKRAASWRTRAVDAVGAELGERGRVEAQAAAPWRLAGRVVVEGDIALAGSGSGRIDLRAEQLVVSQLPDRWVMVSGSGGARLASGRLALASDLRVDAAYVELPPPEQPRLSSDVVVLGRQEPGARATPVSLDLSLDLGERFYFQGAGIDSRLAGQLRLTADRLKFRGREGSGRRREVTGRALRENPFSSRASEQ